MAVCPLPLIPPLELEPMVTSLKRAIAILESPGTPSPAQIRGRVTLARTHVEAAHGLMLQAGRRFEVRRSKSVT